MFFFFNDTATTEIYTLSLHDALPISKVDDGKGGTASCAADIKVEEKPNHPPTATLSIERSPILPGERSEEHTSELQSQSNLVCRLLLEKKKRYHDAYYV